MQQNMRKEISIDVESFCEACESLSDHLVIGDKLMVIESAGAGVPLQRNTIYIAHTELQLKN